MSLCMEQSVDKDMTHAPCQQFTQVSVLCVRVAEGKKILGSFVEIIVFDTSECVLV